MSPETFRAIRKGRAMTQAQVATFLAVKTRSVRRYEAGDRGISGPVEKLMEWLEQSGA